uniref:hypothetical protein n=1 Tax=Ruminococcus flavefaciens TaxID=1265 RepID=UPI0026EB9D52
EKGYINVAALTGGKKSVEDEGEQLLLATYSVSSNVPVVSASIIPDQSADAKPTGEVRPVEEKTYELEVSDGADNMEL